MVDENLKRLISDGLLSADDFYAIWTDLNQMYSELGFSDPMTDADRVREYTYIAQQLKKYIGSKKGRILACESLSEMCDVVEGMMERTREYGTDRLDVAYNFYRDRWLANVYNVLSQIAVSEHEEDEDEWPGSPDYSAD